MSSSYVIPVFDFLPLLIGFHVMQGPAMETKSAPAEAAITTEASSPFLT